MSNFIFKPMLQRAVTILCILLLGSGSFSSAREPVYYSPDLSLPQTPPPLSANQLANLVAPIALYPDPLLSQVLVACTYPLEVVEAQQWLEQNGNLQGQLMDAAKRQNWDPSVQALVAFPDVLALLNSNIRWTTDLGNAFLAQQSDVMDAIQVLRAQARRNGQLVSTPQLSVNSETQNGQNAIEIQPVDPRIMYVPAYDPLYVWGSPVAGAYPALPYQESGYGLLFQSAIDLAGLFSGFPALLGWNGWGWALNWLAHALFINNPFFSLFGFHNSSGGYGESAVWAHNPAHRHGVPYANSFVASRYRGGAARLQTAAPLGMSASGGRKLGSSAQMIPGAQSGRAFAPQRSAGSESFQRDNRAAMPGNWRAFSRGTPTPTGQYTRAFAQPAWAGKRELQPNRRIVRDTYLANSANYRTPSFGGSRSLPSGYGAFSNSRNSRIPSASRTIARSNGLWGQPSHFSPPRMSSHQHASRPQHSFARQHFSAPHFSASHSRSHGSAHFSRGHSGGKSRKR